MQSCYAKWLSTVSVVDIVNLMLHSLCVEWNCYYFFLFPLSYSCLFLCCLLALPYYMANKDEYIPMGIPLEALEIQWCEHTIPWGGTVSRGLPITMASQ